ncbi:MAG: exosortase-associated EpsI family protein [Planctomycetaceae bacterium]
MDDQKISRREMLLIGSGLAALCLGKLADSAINGVGVEDEQTIQLACDRLANLPSVFGNWTSVDEELSEREVEVAEIRSYVRRQYRNPALGYEVHLTILCGHAGPMAVHPPTACFEGVGYTLASGPVIATVTSEGSDQACDFNKSSFRQIDASVPEIVRVFWGWSTDGHWQAPSNPRIAFRGDSYLYKIYVTDRGLENPGKNALPQIEKFLHDALPIISRALTPTS